MNLYDNRGIRRIHHQLHTAWKYQRNPHAAMAHPYENEHMDSDLIIHFP